MSFRIFSIRIAITTALLLVSAAPFTIGTGGAVQKVMCTVTGLFAHPDGDSQSVERSFGQSSSDLGPVWGDNEEFLEDESGENYMSVPTPLVSDE